MNKRSLIGIALLMALPTALMAAAQWPIECTWHYCAQHLVWELVDCEWVGFVVAPSAGSSPISDTQIWREAQDKSFEASLRDSLSAQLPDDVALASANHPEVKSRIRAWTAWLDRDDPGGSGDYETLNDFVRDGTVCASPAEIECRVRGRSEQKSLGRSYICDETKGGICKNGKQLCADYEVRFLCMADW